MSPMFPQNTGSSADPYCTFFYWHKKNDDHSEPDFTVIVCSNSKFLLHSAGEIWKHDEFDLWPFQADFKLT